MIYTQEEKAKMDILLKAFQPYIDQRDDYEVIYSNKAGYLRVLTGESCDEIYFRITGFANMLQMFTNDYLADEEERVDHYLKRDYDFVRRLLMPILDTLGDHRAEAYEIMENTFLACQSQCEQLRQSQLAEIQQLEELLQYLRGAV